MQLWKDGLSDRCGQTDHHRAAEPKELVCGQQQGFASIRSKTVDGDQHSLGGEEPCRLKFIHAAGRGGESGDPADLEVTYGHGRTSRASATKTADAMVPSTSRRSARSLSSMNR